jgi:DNA invertase Pin-like site-specific DNA recombinase
MLSYVRDGDTIVVHSMDHLARNLDDLRLLVKNLTSKQIKVKFVKENLEFTGEENLTILLNSAEVNDKTGKNLHCGGSGIVPELGVRKL